MAAGLFGEYKLLERVGHSADGIDLYRARHVRLQRVVALRRQPAQLLSGERLRRLLEAYDHLARLNHRHILGVFDYGVEEGILYLASELAEGGDLHSRLQREGRLEPRNAAALVADVADALHHAHNRSIVHGNP